MVAVAVVEQVQSEEMDQDLLLQLAVMAVLVYLLLLQVLP
jgi:hypothetical protein